MQIFNTTYRIAIHYTNVSFILGLRYLWVSFFLQVKYTSGILSMIKYFELCLTSLKQKHSLTTCNTLRQLLWNSFPYIYYRRKFLSLNWMNAEKIKKLRFLYQTIFQMHANQRHIDNASTILTVINVLKIKQINITPTNDKQQFFVHLET